MTKKKVGAQRGRVSSPSATGGAGVHFEEHVDAAFLTLLLLRGIPPVLTDCVVTGVHFQAEHLGWATDDAIVVGTNGTGVQRRLFCQVKLSFTVSTSNDECRKAFGDFWSDFKANAEFSAERDRFAIVVQRGTDMLLHHFVSLLDCARSSRDGDDFGRRLKVPGFLNAAALRYAGEIQKIVGDIEGRAMSAGELWPFFKLLHVLPMDLHSSTRQTEAAMKTMLALVS
ncbi:MAG TPA: hypothetical protein VFI31_26585, partial [Pirellulales bacterium]|nr:hypothetical protein [Pirellulales bacterium]